MKKKASSSETFILTKMSNAERINITISWAIRLIRQIPLPLLKLKRRFVLITPPIFSNLIIYDCNTNKVVRIKIRDIVDYCVVCQIFINNDYGLEKLSRGKELIAYYKKIIDGRNTPLIIDCGANIGMSVRYFSDTYTQAHVIAVEPDASNLELALRNNKSSLITNLLAGIGCSDTKAKIIDPGLGSWAYRVEENENGPINIISVNKILNDYSQEKYIPFIIKIDIEGFEANLFKNNTEWIDKFPIIIIELHDWMLPKQGSSNSFLLQMAKRKRDFVYYGENVFSISNTLL